MKIIRALVVIAFISIVCFVIYVSSTKTVDYNHVIKPEYRNIEERLPLSGIAQPVKEFEIKSTISGVMEKLYVEVGDYVKYGDAIAKVRMVKNPEEYQDLTRRLEVARMKMDDTQSKFNRTRQLYENKLISDEEYETAKTDLMILRAEFQSVLAEMNMLKGRYQSAGISNVIRATNQGTVLSLPVKEGGSIMARGSFSEGSTVAKVAELSALIFMANVIESDAIKLRTGMQIDYKAVADSVIHFSGRILSIAPVGVVENGITRFEVKASMNVPDKYKDFIKAGCTINATTLLRSRKHVLALEERFFQFNYDSVYVEVKDKAGKYQKRQLKTGISDGMYTEILSGLSTKDEIKPIAEFKDK